MMDPLGKYLMTKSRSIKYASKGPYIKYVGGGRVYGVMKYFRHILMGHEIFFKNFNGKQNIFYVLFSLFYLT